MVLRCNYTSKYFKVAFYNLTIQSLFGLYFINLFKRIPSQEKVVFFSKNRKQDVNKKAYE